MSLLYRAVWRDDRDKLCDSALESFQTWMQHKDLDLRLPDEGHVERTANGTALEVVVRRALSGAVEAVQMELAEDRERHRERWTTRLTVLDGGEQDRWLWVDLEWVADDASRRPPLAAPKLVRDLIESGDDARVDQVRLTTIAHNIAPAGLAGLIRNEQRTIPLVVFSVDPARGLTPTLRRANETAQRLAGAVQVMVLPAEQTDEFKARVEDGLGVWGGAARVYLPNSGPSGLRPERHRYISSDQLGDDPRRPASILSTMLAAVVTARRPPAIYDAVRRELRLGRDRSDAELLAYAESEIDRLTAERDELKDRLAITEEELLDTQADLESAVEEATRLQNQLQVMLIGQQDATAAGGTVDLAVEARDMSEALRLARERLHNLCIPAGIERDIEILDTQPNSVSWGDLTWRGLRALHLYADEQYDGNFKSWCEHSGHLWAWSASEKKLALRESESVESNRRFAEQRRFPVDTQVDPTGTVIMWSHLKIAEGGGRLAPRVYFHDDTRGVTGKVHIGFVGPHHYTENTKTN